ncbi:MAG: TIM-barrel domain-containing protein [Mycobacterium leprae]
MHVLQTIQSIQSEAQQIVLDFGSERIILRPICHGMVNVRLVRGHQWEVGLPVSPSVVLAPQSGLICRVLSDGTAEAGGVAELAVGDLRIRVEQNPVRLSFHTADGRLIAQESPTGGLAHDGWQVACRFALRPDERLYGLGETEQRIAGPMQLNHRGEVHRIEHNHLPNPSRLVLPFVISSSGYGLFVDNVFPATFDLGVADRDTLAYVADAGVIDYYLMVGTPYEILEAYTALTGRPTLPPRWALGYIQSKFGYRNRAEVEELIATFKAKELPIDAVALDLYWFKQMGDLWWNEEAFPQPAEFVQGLQAQGVKTVVIEEPYIGVNTRLYPAMSRLNMLARKSDGTPFTFPFWIGEDAALADFSNPETREFWTEQHKQLIATGIAGWWTDLNEPEVHYPTMIHHGGPAQAVHNTEAFHMQASVAEAVARYSPDRRPFMMSRSAWAGSQRLGATLWSGDVATTFKALSDQIPLGLSAGLAGFPVWNTDIGGFTGELPTPELYARWIQFGACTPIMRPHGAQQQREPWVFGAEVEAIAAEYIRLHYRLIPYFYTYLAESTRTGAPLLRPLLLEFPDDPRAVAVTDQFLVGRELMVAPVVAAGVTERQVYLPAGTWYDFWTGAVLTGGRTVTVAAPLQRLPLFVRGGSVLPLAPVTANTEVPLTELTYRIYGVGGEFTLYEDDGESLAHQRGVIAQTRVTTDCKDGRWIIAVAAPRGSYAASLPQRQITVEVVDAAAPTMVTVDGAPVAFTHDPALRQLRIVLPPSTRDRVIQIA